MPNPFNKKKGSNASTPHSSSHSIPELFDENDSTERIEQAPEPGFSGNWSRAERGEEEYEDFMNVQGPRTSDLDADADKNLRKYKDYTQKHPMGKLWLEILKGQTELNQKVGLKDMPLSVDDMCTSFYNWQLSENRRMQQKLRQSKQELEETIIDREFNAHLLNQAVEAPKEYSTFPALQNPRARGDCLKLLPSGSNKFSGDPKGMPILEYLFTLKAMQKSCNLSRDEFLEMMRYSTTGKAHMLLLRMIDHGKSVESIFHIFLSHYDKRMQPEAARTQLMAYRAPKSSDFARAEAHIEELAGRVVSNMPAGEVREAAYNAEIIAGLMRSLPPQSAILVINTNNELTAKMNKNPTADQLSRKLNMYRHAIDMDIKANGAADTRMGEKRFNPIRTGSKIKKPNKFSSYNINAEISQAPTAYVAESQPQVWQVQSALNGAPKQNFKPFMKNENKMSNNQGMRKPFSDKRPDYGKMQNNNKGTYNAGNKNSNGNQGSFNRGKGFQNRRFGKPGFRSKDYCSLCGKTDHRAAQGCPNMVDGSGKVVQVMPCKDTCPLCPPSVNPRLSHPSYLCPYKNGTFSS